MDNIHHAKLALIEQLKKQSPYMSSEGEYEWTDPKTGQKHWMSGGTFKALGRRQTDILKRMTPPLKVKNDFKNNYTIKNEEPKGRLT